MCKEWLLEGSVFWTPTFSLTLLHFLLLYFLLLKNILTANLASPSGRTCSMFLLRMLPSSKQPQGLFLIFLWSLLKCHFISEDFLECPIKKNIYIYIAITLLSYLPYLYFFFFSVVFITFYNFYMFYYLYASASI